MDYNEEMRGQWAAAQIVGDHKRADLFRRALENRDKGARKEAEEICRAKWRTEQVDGQ